MSKWFTNDQVPAEKLKGRYMRIGKVRETSPLTAEITVVNACSRCGGMGGADKWAFTGWTCYQCAGSGLGSQGTVKLYTAEKAAKLTAARELRQAKKQAERDAIAAARAEEANAKRVAFFSANRELLKRMEQFASKSDFLADMFFNVNEYGDLTEPQIAAVKNAVEKFEKEKAIREGSQFVGEIGKRIEIELEIEKVIQICEGGYNSFAFYFVLMRDPAGNRLMYKGGSPYFYNEKTLTKYKATVKAHEVYNGENQTILQRIKEA